MRTGGNAAGIAQLASTASTTGPLDSRTVPPPSRSVATTMQRNGRVFEGLVRQVSLDEAAQPAGIDRKAAAEQSQRTTPTDRKDLAATQAAPDRLELRDTARGRCPGEVGSR